MNATSASVVYFIDERGAQPHYYDQEAQARGEDPAAFWAKSYEYNQSHAPVREQSDAVGHAVRAMYMYSAMADLAQLTGDQAIWQACRRLFVSVSRKRMYITGGVGSSRLNEGFTADYDLPNESAYAETCASIALIFWMQRMLQFDCDSQYADVMERALYNGFLSGVSLTGDTFFYVNPLSVHRSTQFLDGRYYVPERQSWFGCACCPPNIARLLASLGNYILAAKGREVAVHLYIQSQARLQIAGEEVLLRQETDYPWDGLVTIFVEPARPVAFTLRLRVPGWRRSHSITLGGEPLDTRVDKGYLVIDRLWQPGDVVQLHLPMPVERMYANPRVRETSCQVALMRGPLVYCLEEVDNGGDLDSLVVPASGELSARFDPETLGGVAVIEGAALRAQPQPDDPLYSCSPVTLRAARLRAVPYFAWGNRGVGDMLVWLHAIPT